MASRRGPRPRHAVGERLVAPPVPDGGRARVAGHLRHAHRPLETLTSSAREVLASSTMDNLMIAVLGTGPVGRAMAGRLAQLGHSVTVGTRDPGGTAPRSDYAGGAPEPPGGRPGALLDPPPPGDPVVNASGGDVALGIL